jgi:hypothetical protein
MKFARRDLTIVCRFSIRRNTGLKWGAHVSASPSHIGTGLLIRCLESIRMQTAATGNTSHRQRVS